MRLIDADELKENFYWSEVCRLSIKEICQIINNAPTVEERPQGKWIKITNDGITPIEYICNNCGRTVKSYNEEYWIEKEYPFCHCGADMRGKKDE